MIKSKAQYVITLSRIESLSRDLDKLRTSDTICQLGETEKVLQKAVRDGLESLISELYEEVREYEALLSAGYKLTANGLEGLGKALVQARLVKGLTQKALAERLGLYEQQIQRYEDSEYTSASYERLLDIVKALGLELQINITLSTDT